MSGLIASVIPDGIRQRVALSLEAGIDEPQALAELCAMPIANASLLDEATAAAEAMNMAHRGLRGRRDTIIVAIVAIVVVKCDVAGNVDVVVSPELLTYCRVALA